MNQNKILRFMDKVAYDVFRGFPLPPPNVKNKHLMKFKDIN